MRHVDRHAAAVREFSRFYTRRIGALGNAYLGSGFSLTEVRVLYELAQRDAITATEIATALELDRGYLSRMLAQFRRRKLISLTPSSSDRRQTLIRLTAAGRRAFAPIEAATLDAVVAMLEPLDTKTKGQVIDAMHTIRTSLDKQAPSTDVAPAPPVVIRDPKPGDFGWVVHRHGALYAAEYGYTQKFEAIAARIVAEFIENFDPARERCWIAERGGEIVGSVFLVSKSKTVAQLRLLLLEPSARGLGLGRRLVDGVIQFARGAGYKKIMLWTQAELTAARHIYKTAGFELVNEEKHAKFGAATTAEIWEVKL